MFDHISGSDDVEIKAVLFSVIDQSADISRHIIGNGDLELLRDDPGVFAPVGKKVIIDHSFETQHPGQQV